MPALKTVEWVSHSGEGLIPGHIRLIDQTRLPTEVSYLETSAIEDVRQAIRTLQVRGAPAIGIAAAMGVAAAAQDPAFTTTAEVIRAAHAAADALATSRPTAVNLFWALERMRRTVREHAHLTPTELKERLVAEAVAVRDEDAAMCHAIGRHGVGLLRDGDAVLTHCNAGGLATAEYGTALAPIYEAHARGMNIHVYADETRPLLQGSRLTAWELSRAGIDVTLICDSAAAQVMREGRVHVVLVGADRIAANGDTANKIGTYAVALLAQAHHVPFYVLAPTSTIDLHTPTGAHIPIEERGREEVTHGFGRCTAPPDVRVYAPAFDVTPAALITGIVCEKGVVHAPFKTGLADAVSDRSRIRSPAPPR